MLRKKSPYNFTNIILADRGDYKTVGKRFDNWLREKILIDDDKESFYLYEQKFTCDKKTYRRFGLLSLLEMKSSIFPHEHTLTKPKQDRKRIIETVKANLDPIFVIVPKPVKALRYAYTKYSKKKPFFKFRDCDGNANILWKIQEHGEIKKIRAAIEKSNLVIADGHHRFEVANDYYKRNKNKFGDLNYVLAYVTDAQPGLVILPTHRVIKMRATGAQILESLGEYFSTAEISEGRLNNALKHKNNNFEFALYHHKKFYFLKLKKRSFTDKIDADPAYKKLDTFLLHQFVLPLLSGEGEIQYTHSIREAKKISGADKFAFILKPVSLATIFEIADKGYRFPQKSTYFQPKVFSGIILRRFRT
jgi:uncharacterized protein (DUF1015 family)